MRRIHAHHPFPLSALALAVAATVAGVASPAIAQQVTAIEEVVVTAQRREESLQDTPISITAFSESKLQDLGVFDVSQVADFAPNVTIQKQPSSNSNMGINIRGVGMGETSLLADPKVGFYLDGVFMSKTVGGVFDVVDLERVEVLRGPQGTLFGRNTTGGAINVTTKKPTGELGGKLEASVGNYGYMRYGGSIDLPAVANISTKLSLNHMETDGWAENHYEGPGLAPLGTTDKSEEDLASEDNWSGRVALRWQPTESLTVDYAYDKTDNEGVPAPFQIVKVKDTLYDGFDTLPVNFMYLDGRNGLFDQMARTVDDPNDRRDNYKLDGVSTETLEIDGHTFTAAWEVSEGLTLKYIFGHRETDSGYDSTDLDGGAHKAYDVFHGTFLGITDPVPTPGFHAAIDEGSIETDTHELQIIGDFLDSRLKYTGGLFYYNEDVLQDNPQTYTLPLENLIAATARTKPNAATRLRGLYTLLGYCATGPCLGTQRLSFGSTFDPTDVGTSGLADFRYGQETESWAAYGQATYAVTEQFDLTVGLRYTEDDKDAFLFNQTLDIDPTNPDEVTNQATLQSDDSWDNVSYMINGNYAFTDDLRVYLKYSTGYNGGGFNARAGSVEGFVNPFAEEEVEVWELGMKSEWMDNRVRFNAAVFTNDYTDIQIAQFEAGAGGASSRIVNAGQGTYQGLELELVMVPVDGLTIDGSYGYLDAEFDEYMALDPKLSTNPNQIEQDISDRTTVAQAPENSWALGVQYDFEPFSWGQLSARLDAAYKDDFVFHPFNNQYDSADERTLIDARLSLNDIQLGCCEGGLRVSLWGKNLTDEEYRNWGIDFASLGFAGAVYGEPLSYGVDVSYSFQ